MKHFNFFALILALCSFQAVAQFEVTGVITDQGNSDPLIGVTVVEKGVINGTASGIDGDFKLFVADEAAVLVISYIGYSTIEIPVNGSSNLTIQMEEDVARLDEVVVVGYGTQKKKEITGAISKVRSEELEDKPVPRIEDALKGRTSGVRVVSNSGQPGDASTVRIRGTSTLNNSDPLYIIDGVPVEGGIDYLSSGDIESIEVLKDAASASIYGARSANGVILVTTKSGEGAKPTLSYKAYVGIQAPWKRLSLLNGTEYATLINESFVAAGEPLEFEDPQSYGEGTDWQSAVFNESAPMQNHEISYSGGNEKSTLFSSFGYFDQTGIVIGSEYKRFNARLNTTQEINNRLKFGNNLSYTRVKSRGVATNDEYGSPLSRAINLDPLTPILETDEEKLNSNLYSNDAIVRNEDGIAYGISPHVTSEMVNPIAADEISQGSGYSDKIVGNLFGELNIIEGLKFRSSIGVDFGFWGGEGFRPIYYLNSTTTNPTTSYSRSRARGLKWIFENNLSYERKFDKHKFKILAGTVGEENKGQEIGGTITNVPVDNLEDASYNFASVITDQTFYGYEYESTLSSILGRLNYNFDSKYLFTATLRRDGSSKFGSNYKYGLFPSFSLGWVLTDENFIKNNNLLNYFKLRGSWGINGNNKIGDFLYESTVGGGRNYTFGTGSELTNGTSPNAIANPDLRWEETAQINIGFDSKLFKKLSLSVDWFDKNSYGILAPIEVPGYVGNAGPTGNIADLFNRGWEFELGYNNNYGKFNYDFLANASYVKNELTFLGSDKEFYTGATYGPQGLEISRFEIGFPVGYFYGYQTNGIFQNQAEIDAYVNSEGGLIQPDAAPGDFKFIDYNGNGEIDPEDRSMIGDPTPDWTYGATADFDWNGISLSIFGQGIQGNEIFKTTRRFDLQKANLTSDALDRWTGEGTSTEYPRLNVNDPNGNFSRSSDFYIENGSFFRIKTVQLGYDLPVKNLAKIGMSKLYVYVSGNNLLTFTKYSGYDPEIGGGSYGIDRGIYPQPRFYLVGINAKL